MAGDEIDPFEIKGNLSVVTSVDPLEFGNGSIDVDGNININGSIGENTLGNGMNIKNLKSLSFKLQPEPIDIIQDEIKLYVDSSDNLLKYKDSSSVTILQPASTKGDLISHDGVSQIRFPVGSANQVLISNPLSSSGLQWVTSTSSTANNIKTIIGTSIYTEVSSVILNSYYTSVYNEISQGPSCNFFYSKSISSIDGNIVRLNSCQGVGSSARLESRWISLEEIEISKTDIDYNGNYSCNTFPKSQSSTNINLSGTDLVELNPSLVGNFVYFISNKIGGPEAIYFLSKNSASRPGSIVRLTGSPGTADNRIIITWEQNLPVQIQKQNLNNNGSYSIFELLSSEGTVSNIVLSGTSPESINNKYQRVSSIVSIKSLVAGGPFAIFTFSKNHKSRTFNSTRIVQSPGVGTNEKIRLTWDINDVLKVYKDGTNYDGNYEVSILN